MTSHLCLFDLDRTLVQERTIERLATHFGFSKRLEAALERGPGEPAAGDEETRRVARLLTGLEAREFENVCADLELRPGAEEAVRELQAMGFRVGVASASYMPAAEAARDLLGLDFAVAVEPVVVDGRLTGEVVASEHSGPCGSFLCKEQVLASLRSTATRFTVAVGDGPNDLCMIRSADLGIALTPCPLEVRLGADVYVNDLRAIPAVVQKYMSRPVLVH